MWDVDTNDWRKPGSSVVAARAVNGAKPGSIILVHDIHASTVAAVDAIVKGLKNRGYELVTVSELIRRGRAAAGHAPSMPAAPAVPDSSPLAVPSIVAPAGLFPLRRRRWPACNPRCFSFSFQPGFSAETGLFIAFPEHFSHRPGKEAFPLTGTRTEGLTCW